MLFRFCIRVLHVEVIGDYFEICILALVRQNKQEAALSHENKNLSTDSQAIYLNSSQAQSVKNNFEGC